jgi:oligoribonuclease
MLLWCDLETTGLDARRNRLLEVAWTITQDNLDTHLVGIRSHVITPTLETLDQLDEFNQQFDMHIKSGLYDEVTRGELTVRVEDAEDSILSDILHGVGDETPIYLTGAGVHFDKAFIAEHMPRLHQRLHYRLGPDASVLSRFFENNFGVTFPTVNDNMHRAADDVKEALTRVRQIKEYVEGLRVMAEGEFQKLGGLA